MKYVCVGVAGHIDHGKTTFVKFLTNKDTDHLKEEKERNISINIAFGFLETKNIQIGFIDMPGHEKFVKNMIAGATSINCAVLLVAANDGVMPQTVEHVNILKLMNIKDVFVVISKTDLVDSKRIDDVKLSVSELLSKNKIINWNFCEVNNKEASSYEIAKIKLTHFCEEVNINENYQPFRLDIDRSFNLKGLGTIVTGTVKNKSLKVNSQLLLYPQMKKVIVREIQSNDKTVEEALPGQRAAIRIKELNYKDIERGNSLSIENGLFKTNVIDVELEYLYNNEQKALKSKQIIQVFVGTRVVSAKLSLLGKKTIDKDQKLFSQLIFEDEEFFNRDERGLFKVLNNQQISGGFKILRPGTKIARWNDEEYIKDVQTLSSGDIYSRTVLRIKTDLRKIVNIDTLYCQFCIGDFKEDDNLVVGKNYVMHKSIYDELSKEVLNFLEKFHMNNPLKTGVNFNSLYNQYIDKFDSNQFVALLCAMQNNNLIKFDRGFYACKRWEVLLTDEQTKLKNFILKRIKDFGVKPKPISTLKEKVDNNKLFDNMLKYLIQIGSIVMLDFEYYISNNNYQSAVEKIKIFFQNHNELTLEDAKLIFGLNHDTTVMLLEKFDKDKITIFNGKYRTLINQG